jgi:uncharacterized protein YneR
MTNQGMGCKGVEGSVAATALDADEAVFFEAGEGALNGGLGAAASGVYFGSITCSDTVDELVEGDSVRLFAVVPGTAADVDQDAEFVVRESGKPLFDDDAREGDEAAVAGGDLWVFEADDLRVFHGCLCVLG